MRIFKRKIVYIQTGKKKENNQLKSIELDNFILQANRYFKMKKRTGNSQNRLEYENY